MMNLTKAENTLNNNTIKQPLSTKHRILSVVLALACILMTLLLAAFITVSAVVLESHTYKRAARNEAYLSGVENTVVDIMKNAARENGLSKTMLMKHVQSDTIRKLAKKNAADAALVLKGSQVIYGDSFDAAVLETDIYKFYEMQLPEPEVNENAETSRTEEDPEREALRELADELATDISAQIDTAVRVIDMEQTVHEYSDNYLIDWLRFMGRGGVLLPLVMLGIFLLLLYRQVWERGFSPWLAGISICSGIALLICAAMLPVMGWMNLSMEPVQLDILCETVIRGLLMELLVMSVLWFIIAYIAIRAAIGKPVSIKWLHTLMAKLRKPSGSSESPIDDPHLFQTIKKAAADSTNSLLGRKGR